MSRLRPVVLVISGLDPTGGAGLLLDVRVLAEHDVYAAGVVSALTDQDTSGVYSVGTVPPAVVEQQIQRVLADLKVAAVKIGMLGSTQVAAAVARALAATQAPLVLDPVLRATGGGAALLDDPAALDPLIRRATLVTPNLDEANSFGGPAGLRARGARAVLVKGGHRTGGDQIVDRFIDGKHVVESAFPRIPGGEVHGTGCALASSIAAHLARGARLAEAVALAQAYVRDKIAGAQKLGRGSRIIV
ncbi:MAG TPA: bifunctional hydroxymethylpyrimidine kinase/phosphomethylpyrimidine kinase [Polyangia bacterium]|nr:bifunctional hydroxymethylpyrimidine kinase/phosphomethylpyrimidine kinase [Polyangia bacterium]